LEWHFGDVKIKISYASVFGLFFKEEGVKFEKLYNDQVHLFVNNLFFNVIKKSEI
jgi:hypothetical protein